MPFAPITRSSSYPADRSQGRGYHPETVARAVTGRRISPVDSRYGIPAAPGEFGSARGLVGFICRRDRIRDACQPGAPGR